MRFRRDDKGRFATTGRVRVTEFQDRPHPTLAAIRAWKKTGRPKTGTVRRTLSAGVHTWVSNESGTSWPERQRGVRRTIAAKRR